MLAAGALDAEADTRAEALANVKLPHWGSCGASDSDRVPASCRGQGRPVDTDPIELVPATPLGHNSKNEENAGDDIRTARMTGRRTLCKE